MWYVQLSTAVPHDPLGLPSALRTDTFVTALLIFSQLMVVACIVALVRCKGELGQSTKTLAWGVAGLLIATALAQLAPHIWPLDHWISGLFALAALIAASTTCATLPRLIRLPTSGMLQRQLSDNEMQLARLRGDLVQSVSERASALLETTQRFEATILTSQIFVSNQDRDLRYTWAVNPPAGLTPERMIGRLDEELLPASTAQLLSALKRAAIDAASHREAEARIETEQGSHWYDVSVDPLFDRDHQPIGITTVAVDVTHRKRIESQLRRLTRDVTHRAKNVLAVVHAIARQTAARTATKEQFLERFANRVQSLARAHDLLVNQDWRGVGVDELIRSQLADVDEQIGTRIHLDGPELALGPEATQNLGLAIHELTDNARKHGALSTPAGTLAIDWHLKGDGPKRSLVIQWLEHGGPAVVPSPRAGFGRTFLENAAGNTLDGRAHLEFRPDGVAYVIEVPPYHLIMNAA